jgi:23S rRNA pseudouridine2605 synthase
MSIRLSKALSQIGAKLSRRGAEKAISEGRVSVNGEVVRKVVPVERTDSIVLDGRPISLAKDHEGQLFIHFKRRGFLVSHDDPAGRPTVINALLSRFPHLSGPLWTAGRLDGDSEGLLLVATSPSLIRPFSGRGVLREYLVRVRMGERDVTPRVAGLLAAGKFRLGGERFGRLHLEPLHPEKHGTRANVWYRVRVGEGRNREVRRVLGACGLEVNRLMRISHGPYTLPEFMKPGDLLEVDFKEPTILPDLK